MFIVIFLISSAFQTYEVYLLMQCFLKKCRFRGKGELCVYAGLYLMLTLAFGHSYGKSGLFLWWGTAHHYDLQGELEKADFIRSFCLRDFYSGRVCCGAPIWLY